MVPALFHNLRKALLPFMDENIYSEMKSVCSKIEDRSKSSRSSQSRQHGEQKKNKSDESSIITESKGEDEVAEEETEEVKKDSDFQSTKCEDGYCVPCYELA